MRREGFEKLIQDLVAYFKIDRREIHGALFLLFGDKENLEVQGQTEFINISFETALTLLSNFDFYALRQIIIVERK